MADTELAELLRAEYRLVGRHFVALSGRTIAVTAACGERYMVRRGDGAGRMAATLLHLERHAYPAARVLPSTEGAAVTALPRGESITVMTYVDGSSPAFEARPLRAVGAALGRLHALGPADTLPAPPAAPMVRDAVPVTRAQMLPSNECGPSDLLAAEHLVSAELRPQFDRMVAAIDDLSDDFAACSQVLLHGDCHPWNAVIVRDGSARYVDWDSSGPGPLLVDLGFFLLSCDRGPMTHPPVPSDGHRLVAAIDGYREHHRLVDADIDRLCDAITFRALVFAVGLFVDDLNAGRDPRANAGWWERCLAAEEIADRARSRLAS